MLTDKSGWFKIIPRLRFLNNVSGSDVHFWNEFLESWSSFTSNPLLECVPESVACKLLLAGKYLVQILESTLSKMTSILLLINSLHSLIFCAVARLNLNIFIKVIILKSLLVLCKYKSFLISVDVVKPGSHFHAYYGSKHVRKLHPYKSCYILYSYKARWPNTWLKGLLY